MKKCIWIWNSNVLLALKKIQGLLRFTLPSAFTQRCAVDFQSFADTAAFTSVIFQLQFLLTSLFDACWGQVLNGTQKPIEYFFHPNWLGSVRLASSLRIVPKLDQSDKVPVNKHDSSKQQMLEEEDHMDMLFQRKAFFLRLQ